MTINDDNNNELPRPVPAGNDISEGDAREEGRMDKDEDLKKGDDNDSPLAEPFKAKKKGITPDGLRATGNEHNKHNNAEHEEPDPTMRDAPDLRTDSPDVER